MPEGNRKFIFPIIVGMVIVGVIMVIAFTDITLPLINYIHTNSITTAEAIACIVAGIVFICLIYQLLVRLG